MDDFLQQISALSPQRLALFALKLKESLDQQQAATREPIAVIGIGCRFPGADGPDAFWALLKNGRESICEVPGDRWPIDQYYDSDPDAPGKMSTRNGGYLDRVDGFDPGFFGITPREALVMDPQQRLLLEVSWEALEHAGLDPTKLAGSRTGVFAGICNTDYLQLLLRRSASTIDAYLASGNAHSVASGRVSYVLGLQGPSMSIDTSCSASLVAIHEACQSLRANESTLALAGGVNVICAPETTIALSKSHMLAPDGRCKTFDASADGFSRGEGCGMVVLKRLSDAKRDGDRILALVRGTAINQDGRSVGLTVPNGPAQEAVIREALEMSDCTGAAIDFVEAHGTGTSLGDPIEVRALARVLGDREGGNPLVIGSVKTNFGHLESAAGVAGFIKVVLALQNEQIPQQLHFKTPSPHIEWKDFPIIVAAENRAWPRGQEFRRAGVSSFGFSGTNSHVILEEAPILTNVNSEDADRPLHCIPLSARNDAPLRELAKRYAAALSSGSETRLADVAHTAAAGRSHFAHRAAVIAGSKEDACAALRAIADGVSTDSVRSGTVPPGGNTDVVFLYTGAGAQYPGMGQALYDSSPVFREAIDRCSALLGQDARGLTLNVVLRMGSAADAPVHDIAWTQPALFAVEYALTELWRSWGVEPAAAIGHSAGEYAAACAAGVFSLEDGLRLIAERGRLLQSLPSGGLMAALFAPAEEVAAAVEPVADRVAIAAINAPESVVISGETAAVEAILAAFAQRNVKSERLHDSLAPNSPLAEPVLDAMERLAAATTASPPRIPIAWNLTGAPLPQGTAPDARYWRRHLRETVRFADGIKMLRDEGYRIFLEVGPHPTLLSLVQQSRFDKDALFLASLRRGKDDWSELLTSLAELYVRGVPVDWTGVDRPYPRQRVALPTYPFERERFWAAPLPQAVPAKATSDTLDAEAGNAKGSTKDIFFKMEWERAQPGRSPAARPDHVKPRRWLVLADESTIGERMKSVFSEAGDAVTVIPSAVWRTAAMSSESLQLWIRDSIEPKGGAECVDIVYLGALGEQEGYLATNVDSPNRVLALLKSVAEIPACRVWLVTRGAQDVDGIQDVVAPDQATLWGLGRTFALEHPDQWGGLIDLDPDGDDTDVATALAEALKAEDGEDQMAWRDGVLRVPRLATAEQPQPGGMVTIKPDASYLVTGGLGGLGLAAAEWLATHGARHIVLVSRTPVPARQEWSNFPTDPRVTALAALERQGVTAITEALDVSDPVAMESLMAKFGKEWPRLAGIVHAAVKPTAASIREMSPDTLEAMFRTKVQSAYLLDALSANQPVEFFVMFSTTTALLGSVQLAHYAAANAVLDALACRRRASGHPALSVNWGPWDRLWSISEEEREWIIRGGLRPIPIDVGFRALESLLASGTTRAMVADVDWPALRAVYETRRSLPLLSRLVKSVAQTAQQPENDEKRPGLVDQLARAPLGVRHELVIEFVRGEVTAVMGLDGSQPIALEAGLFEMGMDSLMSVELRRRLEQKLGRQLPSTLTFNYPNIGALANYLEGILPEVGQPEVTAVSTPTMDVELTDESLNTFTDAELEARMIAKLEKIQ